MESRMNRYNNDSNDFNTRYHRNEALYEEISKSDFKSDIDNYNIKSNATVIGDNKNEIDVEKIKKILDMKYNNAPKRQSIRLEVEEEEEEETEPTKEYDINVVIEKAKEQKEENYDEERFRKLHNTQFDILKNLDVIKEDEEEAEEEVDDDLKKLINTIALNEHKNHEKTEVDPLDILSDLKGSDDTEVLEGFKEETPIEEKSKSEKEKVSEKEEETVTNIDTKMINSFYTKSNALKSDDFEELDEDFKNSVESNSIIIKILICLIIIVFIIGLVLFVKTLYFS